MNRIANHVCAALMVFFAMGADAAPGEIDTSFAASTIPECVGATLAPAESGAFYVACASSNGTWLVIKFRADGTRDTRWGDGGVTRSPLVGAPNFPPQFARADPDGGFRIVTGFGGAFRFLPNGSLDKDFAKFGELQNGALFDGQTIFNLSLRTMPDGGMVALNYRATESRGTRGDVFVVRKLRPDGSLVTPVSELRYEFPAAMRASDPRNTQGPMLAWSLQADDTLEVLLPDFVTGQRSLGELRVFRIRPSGEPSLQPDRSFPVRGIANFTHRQLRVFGDGSKLYFAFLSARWLSSNRIDPAYEPSYPIGCKAGETADGLSILANGGYVSYDSVYVFLGGPFGGRARCDGLFLDPRLANGRPDTMRTAAFAPLGEQLNYSSIVVPDGGIVVLRLWDMRLQRVQGYGPRAETVVVEYYHAGLDHYFITATPAEIDGLDNAVWSGWKRTGHRFGAWNIETPQPNTEPVCRYYGDLTAGPNSHFYSAEKFECDILAQQEAATPIGRRAWRFERSAFRITVPVAGKCNEALVPVRRVYNMAGPGKDPNHRYLTSDSEFQLMLAKGWADEGVHMCATPNLQ